MQLRATLEEGKTVEYEHCCPFGRKHVKLNVSAREIYSRSEPQSLNSVITGNYHAHNIQFSFSSKIRDGWSSIITRKVGLGFVCNNAVMCSDRWWT